MVKEIAIPEDKFSQIRDIAFEPSKSKQHHMITAFLRDNDEWLQPKYVEPLLEAIRNNAVA